MGALQSSLKTTFINDATTVASDIAQLSTDYIALEAARVALRTLDDGTVYFGNQGQGSGILNPYEIGGQSLRLDDLVSKTSLAGLIALSMMAQSLRPILDAYDQNISHEQPGSSALVTTLNNILQGH